jgi:DNA-binding SARP family transcriptional activator
MLGEELAANLHRLSSDATRAVSVEAHARPARWVSALRLSMEQGGPAAAAAAELLAEIGTSDDAAYLRLAARGKRSLRPAALRITRRLAPKVLVADLGVVDVTVGGHVLPRGIRRKVLALLCFVSSRPAMAVTRDEAVEAIWPGLGPETAVNSLHQTIYFLRRVFETDYREGLSAGYVDFEGEVLRLNPELVDATSRLCWRLVADWKAGRATAIDELLAHYTNTYALDFTYEEWAAGYRDNLHAAVLDAMDREIGAALNRGDFDRAIQMAQQILRVDPTADAIELLLLRAYKRSKRHAAAAEQYAHYAAVLREELGAEPPPFSDI